MTGDDKLKQLTSSGREAPRADARERALLAAMDAFDAGEAGTDKKMTATPQGSAGH